MHIELIDDVDLIGRLGQSTGDRSTGLHLSQIYGSLMKQLQPKRFTGGPFNHTKVETGLVFENMLERGLTEKFATVRPGELFSDEGIAMSPDGINPELDCGEEYKCTWMSSSRKHGGTSPYTDANGEPSDKYLHWFLQMKGYAKWLGTRSFLLRALHVNGDYSYPMGPQFMSHRIEFTDGEVDENWSMLMNHARSEGML